MRFPSAMSNLLRAPFIPPVFLYARPREGGEGAREEQDETASKKGGGGGIARGSKEGPKKVEK